MKYFTLRSYKKDSKGTHANANDKKNYLVKWYLVLPLGSLKVIQNETV